jgi:origin recognition complex subunit 4
MTLEKMHGKRPIPLTNLSDEYTKVNTVISQTITAGESNSMLLIGARGSGKTALVNHVLREQAKEHPDDFHAVRLNGFIHTDDKIALREIWRQLGREMDLDEEENTTRNYADTLASLLALLSHPLELGQEQAPGQTNKSVIFILDEFELFASHPRQTLLYNLFDIAQSRKAPIAVLGLTTRIDVAESLEKRVKSRFSHRYVHLSSPKSFSAFVDVCKAALCIEEDSVHERERGTLDLDDEDGAVGSALDIWNTAIEGVFETDAFVQLLRRTYYTTKSVNDLIGALLIPLSTLPSSAATAAAIQEHIITALGPKLMSPDSKLILLSTLSTLQLALLICAARQTAIHSTETVSFNLAYEEYKLLASKAKIQAAASGAMGAGGRLWTKDIAKDAWMDLIDVGLMMEDGYSGRTGGGAAGRADVSLEEIARSGVDLGSWGRWCKEI